MSQGRNPIGAVVLMIEEAEFFESYDPPSFVFYADLFRDGRWFGRVDVVTRMEIRDGELWFTQFHIHGLTSGAFGRSGLNALAYAIMEDSNVKTLVIEGGS